MPENSNREKFIRWQGRAITQLSYSINLILTFSIAGLGFGASLLFNESFEPTLCQACSILASLFLLLISVAFGVWCTINRLRDFRATKDITNIKRKDESSQELPSLRDFANKLGNKTWGIFWWQIGTFTSGIVIMVLSVAFITCKRIL
ncbi:MAG: hypothetical protein JAY68_06415 [Candidatus Thiodiazotropha taylori]|nr:hypothetical protein [Candidatus Thiodiazotropha taylori]